jgi:hypothetical protein
MYAEKRLRLDWKQDGSVIATHDRSSSGYDIEKSTVFQDKTPAISGRKRGM